MFLGPHSITDLLAQLPLVGLGPHAVASMLEVAAQLPLAGRGLHATTRLAAPLALRRVRRMAAGVLVPASTEIVGEVLEDIPCGLVDVALAIGVLAILLATVCRASREAKDGE